MPKWYALHNIPNDPTTKRQVRKVYRHNDDELALIRSLCTQYPQVQVYSAGSREQARQIAEYKGPQDAAKANPPEYANCTATFTNPAIAVTGNPATLASLGFTPSATNGVEQATLVTVAQAQEDLAITEAYGITVEQLAILDQTIQSQGWIWGIRMLRDIATKGPADEWLKPDDMLVSDINYPSGRLSLRGAKSGVEKRQATLAMRTPQPQPTNTSTEHPGA
jgi:hypothetical protein